MKQFFEDAEIELVRFELHDIICYSTSGTNQGGGNAGEGYGSGDETEIPTGGGG